MLINMLQAQIMIAINKYLCMMTLPTHWLRIIKWKYFLTESWLCPLMSKWSRIVQGQVGWGPEQPELLGWTLACGSGGVGTGWCLRSPPSQTYPWFWDSMIPWFKCHPFLTGAFPQSKKLRWDTHTALFPTPKDFVQPLKNHRLMERVTGVGNAVGKWSVLHFLCLDLPVLG